MIQFSSSPSAIYGQASFYFSYKFIDPSNKILSFHVVTDVYWSLDMRFGDVRFWRLNFKQLKARSNNKTNRLER